MTTLITAAKETRFTLTDKSLKLIFSRGSRQESSEEDIYIYIYIYKLCTCAKGEKEKRHEITLSKRVTEIT